jgi:hypothetical protein
MIHRSELADRNFLTALPESALEEKRWPRRFETNYHKSHNKNWGYYGKQSNYENNIEKPFKKFLPRAKRISILIIECRILGNSSSKHIPAHIAHGKYSSMKEVFNAMQ